MLFNTPNCSHVSKSSVKNVFLPGLLLSIEAIMAPDPLGLNCVFSPLEKLSESSFSVLWNLVMECLDVAIVLCILLSSQWVDFLIL